MTTPCAFPTRSPLNKNPLRSIMNRPAGFRTIRRFVPLIPMVCVLILLVRPAFPVYAKAAGGEPASIGIEDGDYTIAVSLAGGSGRASVTSPTTLTVTDGLAYARIEWSSSHYDYMRIGEEQFLPVNTDGNSVFEIPVTVLDAPMAVIADTTAMSVPHEVAYTLTFESASLAVSRSTAQNRPHRIRTVATAVLAVCVIVWLLYNSKKERNRTE
ncbi:MAG: hypothetical protein LUE65_00800 [Clostridiales bacterium]|nr:hypothetical protein [Clostridiales bacterium]MCD8369983.1 hypothetical protein [Clostridiales bacterium]